MEDCATSSETGHGSRSGPLGRYSGEAAQTAGRTPDTSEYTA